VGPLLWKYINLAPTLLSLGVVWWGGQKDSKRGISVEGLYCERSNPMSGVFRTIDPPTPSPPGDCVPPAFGAGGGHTRWVERVRGVNSSEDARHCSALYICKYFLGIGHVDFVR
jgi:hypothetical protein